VPRWGLWVVRANRFVGTRLFMDRDGLPTAELVAVAGWGKKSLSGCKQTNMGEF